MIDVSAVAAWGARGCLVWPDGEAHHMARHTVLPAAVLMAVLPRVPMRVPCSARVCVLTCLCSRLEH